MLATIAAIGAVIAAYLTVVKLAGGVPTCGPLAGCETVREALSLTALRRAGGDPRAAARLLFSDYASRVECELASEAQARRVVVESLDRIAERAVADAAPALPGDLIDFADDDDRGTTDGPASGTQLIAAERAA